MRLRPVPESQNRGPAGTGTGTWTISSRRVLTSCLAALCAVLVGLVLSAPAALALPSAFGEEGEGAGQFKEPAGVAVDQESGDLFLADKNNRRAERWSGAGVFGLAWGWGVADGSAALQTCTTKCFAGLPSGGAGALGSETGGPSGVAVDNSGLVHDVYVADPSNLRVEKFSQSGEFLLMFGKGVNAGTGDLCLAAEAAKCQAGESGSGPGEFVGLGRNAVAVGSSGVVYVGESERVEKFTPGGEFAGEVALAGIGQVESLAVDATGALYVTASGVLGVHKYDGTTGSELGEPRDPSVPEAVITLGPSDELFVYRAQQGHVEEYDAAGTQISSFVESGNSGGIAFGNAAGALYVLHEESIGVVAPPPPGPVVVAGSESADELLPTSVVAHAVLNPEGAASEYHFEYGTTTAYGESTAVAGPLTTVNEVQSVSVAAIGGTFTLAFKGEPSPAIPFNATAAEAQAALEAITGVGAGQVAVSGEPGGPWSVEFTGARAGQDVPELTADASGLTGPEPGHEPSATVATATPGISLFDDRAASAAIKGLTPNTTYHFRVVVSNSTGETPGPDQTFTTAPSVSVVSESASQVTSESARLEATLNAHGLPSTFHFQYGRTAAYEKAAPIPDGDAGSSSSDNPVSVLVEGLSPGVTYHYRVVATNALGESDGPDQTFTTQGAAPTALADGRGWELVSPPNKHGGPIQPMNYEGSVVQAAQSGRALAYWARAPVTTETKGSRSATDIQLLSTRTGAGWSTLDVTPPHEEVTGVLPGEVSDYRIFAADLSVGFLEPLGQTRLAPALMGANGERTPYRREPDGAFTPLVTASNTPPGAKFGGEEVNAGLFAHGVEFLSMTPDGSTVVLRSHEDPLTEGFTSSGQESLYEWHDGGLRVVSVLPNGKAAAEEGLIASLGNGDLQVRHAVSDDGSRVVFAIAEGGDLFLRDVSRGETVRLDAPEPGVKQGVGVPVFQTASTDDSRVFFTDTARLTGNATAKAGKPDLYVCDVAVVAGGLSCSLHDLTVDHNVNEAADVQGAVIAASDDGRLVYFVANGALAPGAAHGECGGTPFERPAASCNLYVRDLASETTSLVAVLSNRDSPGWSAHGGASLSGVFAGASGSGRFLAFMSSRSLTGYDNRDAHSGERDQEVFLYDSTARTLSCASCDPTGARPVGVFDPHVTPPPLIAESLEGWEGEWLAGSIPGWTPMSTTRALYRARYVFDSGRLFFSSPSALMPSDTNGREDVYEFEPDGIGGCRVASGCVALISSGSSTQESAFLDASASGDDVFFLTSAKLVSQDVDSAFDVYDAHVCSSALPCPSGVVSVPPACSTTDSCRAAPVPQPDLFGAPASATFSGAGNVAPVVAPVVKKRVVLTRAQKYSRALAACKRQPKRKRAACRASARRRYGPHHAKKSSHVKNGGRGK
jgi:hypothetical protein